MTQIEHYTPTPNVPAPYSGGANLIRESAAVMSDAKALADAVCGTSMVPVHFKGKPDEAAAAMLLGASLDLDPMQSLRSLYVVHGQPGFYARAMVALVLGKGHKVWTVESTNEAVTVAGQRRGTEHVERSTWDIARAELAGYTSNSKYQTDPQAMLYAKAAAEVCRKIAPDALTGLYTVEELQVEHVQSEVVHVDRGGLASALGRAEQSDDASTPEPAFHKVEDVGPGDNDSPLLNTRSKLAVAMYSAITAFGIPEAERIAFVGNCIDRDISSTKEMTDAEASLTLDVIARLTAERDKAES